MALSRIAGGSIGTLTPNQSIYEVSSTAKHEVGERFAMGDGRVFYYGKAATTIAAGQLVSPDYSDGGPWLIAVDGACVAITAANRQLGDTSKAITAALAIGDNGIGVTHGSYLDGIEAGQLKNGFISLCDTGTTNHIYKIKDNTAVAAVTADVIELLIYDEIAVATVDATCSVSVAQNPFMQLALCDSAVDEHPSGVATFAMSTTNPYGWIQTWGECIIQSATDTAFAGTGVAICTTAGAVDQMNTNGILTIVGYGISDVASAADGLFGYIMLRP